MRAFCNNRRNFHTEKTAVFAALMSSLTCESFIYDIHKGEVGGGNHKIFGNFADRWRWFLVKGGGIFLILWTSTCAKSKSSFFISYEQTFTFVWLLAVITPPFKLFLVICCSIMEAQEV